MKNSENADMPMSAIVEALLPRSLPSVRKTSADLPQIRDEALQRTHASVESRAESQHKHNLLDIAQTSNKTYYMWQTCLTRPSPSDLAHARRGATLECDSSALRTAELV